MSLHIEFLQHWHALQENPAWKKFIALTFLLENTPTIFYTTNGMQLQDQRTLRIFMGRGNSI